MKTITLFLVSMFILFGCNGVNGPTISLFGVGTNDGEKTYKAIISVKYENGGPCTTAYAIIFPDTFIADNNGEILLSAKINTTRRINFHTITRHCVV